MALAALSNLIGRTQRPASRMVPAGVTLVAMPPSLRLSDPMFYAEWMSGRFALAGTSVALLGRRPFDIIEAPAPWLRALYGFEWLRHISLRLEPEASRYVENQLRAWLDGKARQRPLANDVSVVARRVLSWLAHADVLLQTDAADHYDRLINALSRDVATLEAASRNSVATSAEAAARLLAAIAVTTAALAIDSAESRLKAAEMTLASVLAIRPAQPHTSPWRVPTHSVELTLELETLRRFYLMRGLSVPSFLSDALVRLRAMLGALMLGDSTLARLGHAGADAEERQRVWLLVRHAGVSNGPAAHDKDLGVAKLKAGDTCVVADIGAPLGERFALAIEMSSGNAPLIVQDGVGADADRSTTRSATLGTTIINAAQQGVGLGGQNRRYSPVMQPAHDVVVEIGADGPQRIDATHAQYAQLGLAHRRRLTLSQDGRRLDVNDELRPLAGAEPPQDMSFLVRLVLHPDVRAHMGGKPDTLRLVASNGHVWRLVAPGLVLSVEGISVQSGAAMRNSLQVLIAASASERRSVVWSLERQQ